MGVLPGIGGLIGRLRDFPKIAATAAASVFGSSGSSRAITLPSGIALNDLVILTIGSDTPSVTYSTPSGFTPISGAAYSNANGSGNAFYRFCDGTETGTATTTSSGSTTRAVGTARRITGADPATAPTATTASGDSSTPDPPNHTPAWGLEKTLWFAVMNMRAVRTFSSYPTNYTLGQVGATTGAMNHWASARELEATSEDPGSYALTGGASEWNATTIAIKPA